jgi:hypothetical protein
MTMWMPSERTLLADPRLASHVDAALLLRQGHRPVARAVGPAVHGPGPIQQDDTVTHISKLANTTREQRRTARWTQAAVAGAAEGNATLRPAAVLCSALQEHPASSRAESCQRLAHRRTVAPACDCVAAAIAEEVKLIEERGGQVRERLAAGPVALSRVVHSKALRG